MTRHPIMNVDPASFGPQAIALETCAFNDKIEKALAMIPTILQIPPQLAREARTSGRSFLGPVVPSPNGAERSIDGPAGAIPLRVFATPDAKGVLLHIHGGGWALGAHNQQDALLDLYASCTGLAVVSVGYRLAPEHPYPAAPDDCEAAAIWLQENAAGEFGTDRLYIGGESAGAHLSVVTLLRLRDRHGLAPFRGAALSYGAYDLEMTPSARRWGEGNLVLSTPIIQQYADWFAPVELRADPDVSPLKADLCGMPPALFVVGTLDPLLDDSLFMAGRWCAAGNAAELAVYPGGIHAFNAFPIAIAMEANMRICDFFKRCIVAPH